MDTGTAYEAIRETIHEAKVARGVPTKLDVDKLIHKFGIPGEGDTIMWQQIEETLRMGRREYRFRSVTHAWRRKLESEHDILLYPVVGVGLAVADANTKVDIAARKIALGEGNKRRWVEVAFRANVGELDAARKDVQARLLAAHGAFLKLTRATAPKSLPIPG